MQRIYWRKQMNKQEFSKLWEECIVPSFNEMKCQDENLYLRDGSFDSLCRCYNDIKNNTKNLFMKRDTPIRLDRHKIAACLAKAIVINRPICKKVGDEYTGAEENFLIANESLAFVTALSILRAYIELKLENRVEEFVAREAAYRKICELDFVFPQTIMHVDYSTSVCWAWHHNIIDGHFDVLGTANLLFMIENYSVEAYSK